MEALPAIAPDKLIALMIAGAVFSLAGLWLLFRPAKDGDAAKIELFGLKFQSSSAGLLVFLVGAVFFVGGIMLPERQVGIAVQPGTTQAGGSGSPLIAGVPQGGPQDGGRVVGPVQVEGTEAEPNDSIGTANQVLVGSETFGAVEKGAWDFYTFTFPEGFYGRVAVNVRGNVGFAVFDSLGARIDGVNYSRTYPWRAQVRERQYFVQVWPNGSDRRVDYTLLVAAQEQ